MSGRQTRGRVLAGPGLRGVAGLVGVAVMTAAEKLRQSLTWPIRLLQPGPHPPARGSGQRGEGPYLEPRYRVYMRTMMRAMSAAAG
jgi:hypothetical protein